MTNQLTPATHEAVTAETLTITFGPGALKHELVIPKGTLCRKLNAGSDPWVVHDLGFIEDKRSIVYHDADHHGIRVPEDKLTDITPI
jgi:hypothetical protein